MKRLIASCMLVAYHAAYGDDTPTVDPSVDVEQEDDIPDTHTVLDNPDCNYEN